MNRSTRAIVVLAWVVLGAMGPAGAGAIQVPVEPQTENPEFALDVWTNRYDRYWREAWDGGDNRFRMRFGSNNVREWFLEEELKLAAGLLPDRLRFRFYHSRLHHDSSDRRDCDTFELELRAVGRHYASFVGSPTFTKAENSIGLVYQYRTRVDEYLKLIVEFPHATRNFAERHGERPGKQYVVFTDQPIRLVLEGRGALVDRLWSNVVVDVVPAFETAVEDNDTGASYGHEGGEAASVGGWVEYAWGGRSLEQTSVGCNFLLALREKKRPAAVSRERALPQITEPPAALPGPGRIPVGVGGEFYELTEPDSVSEWRDERAALEPFAWIRLDDRRALKTSVRLDFRSIERAFSGGDQSNVENLSVVAGAGAQVKLGATMRSVLEGGFALEYRKRQESRGAASDSQRTDDTYRDHRLYVSYEYRFGPTRIIRLVETIDLDREDWGSFSIHDHGFVQAIFSF